MVDIRIPIGLMFTIVGIIITIFGAVTTSDPMYQKSLGINVNLIMGVFMLVFGLFMLYLTKRKKKA